MQVKYYFSQLCKTRKYIKSISNTLYFENDKEIVINAVYENNKLMNKYIQFIYKSNLLLFSFIWIHYVWSYRIFNTR